MAKGFGFTKIITADVDRVFAFYQAVFGLEEQVRVRQGEGEHQVDEIITMGPGGDRSGPTLVIQSYPNRPLPAPGEATLGFVVDDADEIVARALAHGGSVYRAVHAQPQHGIKVGFVRDCGGHMIELVEML